MSSINILNFMYFLFLLLFNYYLDMYCFITIIESRFHFQNVITNIDSKVIMMILSYSKFDFKI